MYSGVMMTPKGRREAMGFTQTELAERIGIAQSHYGQIELGKTRAKPETRRAISQALGMRHIDLLVELGELEDWEVPGFSADTPEPDPDLARQYGEGRALCPAFSFPDSESIGSLSHLLARRRQIQPRDQGNGCRQGRPQCDLIRADHIRLRDGEIPHDG